MSIRAIGKHSYASSDGITTPVTIGNFTSIAPGVRMHPRIQHPCAANPLLVSTASDLNLRGYPKATSEEGITIGSDVWIGQGAVLAGNITIGHGAIVGMYSVVVKDVPPYAVVVGNPIQHIRYRFVPQTIDRLLTIRWWDWPDEVIAERQDDLRDVRVLIEKYGYEVFAATSPERRP